MAKQEAINLLQFQEKFNTKEACQEHLFKLKWPNGYNCPRCGHTIAYETNTRKLTLYECANCRYQATVTVDTVMEKTRTPLNIWFWAIYLVSYDKRGISAIALAKEFNLNYKTAWLMLHKIRHAMTNRDSQYFLSGIVELDDSMFGAPTEGGKRGRGTDKTKVVVGLSLNKNGHPLYVKMEVVDDLKSQTLADVANRIIEDGSTINTDLFKSYNALKGAGFQHEPKEFNPKDNPDHLHWLHTIVSNVKAFIAGTYHGLDVKHLQAYLNEYAYRFNRRKFKGELFNRLLHCCANTPTITYSELTA